MKHRRCRRLSRSPSGTGSDLLVAEGKHYAGAEDQREHQRRPRPRTGCGRWSGRAAGSSGPWSASARTAPGRRSRPTYTRICDQRDELGVQARRSSRRPRRAATTSQSAACTIRREVTTKTAATSGDRSGDAEESSRHASSLRRRRSTSRAGVDRLRCGHRPHPVAQPVLLVRQVADVGLGVLELRRPEQRVERARLDADPAVHAQARSRSRTGPARSGCARRACSPDRRRGLGVRVDVDAPARALARAEHAGRCSSPPAGAITPRVRGGSSGWTSGYCSVTRPAGQRLRR